MFYTIFKYELKYWFRQPLLYVYAIFFFVISLGTMWGMSSESSTEAAIRITNSPLQINRMANLFNKIMLFLLPSIFGVSLYRDFSSKMHYLMYSFPFSKRDYLLAKFLSALCMASIVITMVGLGFILGTQMPGINNAFLVAFNPWAYLQLYFVYLIPNILLFGAIVFAVVSYTRNVYAGFITVVMLIIAQAFIEATLGNLDNRVLGATISPFGKITVQYYTRYWTAAERNSLMIPFDQLIILNRIIWLSISALIFGLAYKYFSFSQHAKTFKFKKSKEARYLKNNFGSITKINLPKVKFNFSFWQQLKISWLLSKADFKSIISSWPFISILLAGIVFVFFQQIEMNPEYGFSLLPVTWRMLSIPSIIFSGVINFLTFLYAGILVHRAKTANMNQLLDMNPIPNWTLLLSKVIALIKMQVLLTAVVMVGGIAVQIYHGYYHFEIGNYLFELFVLNLIHYIIWGCLAIFIHVLIDNLYLGFFVLILIPIGMTVITQVADLLGFDFLQRSYFQYNQVAGFNMIFDYSDLSGYGNILKTYLVYKTYWLLAGITLVLSALLFWKRGLSFSLKERWAKAVFRFKGKPALAILVFLFSFLGFGFGLFYEHNFVYTKIKTDKEEELWSVESEKKYKQYQNRIQPKITAAKINMDIFPNREDFNAQGVYNLVNQSSQNIDTLLINYSYNEITSYEFNRNTEIISLDDKIRFDVLLLKESLVPGDSIQMTFNVSNEQNTFLRTKSKALKNGSFISNSIFPNFGYRDVELRDNKKRAEYGLAKRETSIPHPSDSTALGAVYGNDSDRIRFEAIISTSEDQIAIAPGGLKKEWIDQGRRYFHYKAENEIPIAYTFHSGKYKVRRDQWKDVQLEIYYHPSHDYNLDNILKGIKASLSYCTEHFSPFQNKQIRVVEYSRTQGTYATVIANIMPYAETYFIGKIDSTRTDLIDFPFYVSAHEIAHYWWGKQINPANVLGAKMLTESIAEYVALKVLEREHGKEQMRTFLKHDLDLYLQGRANERKKESPILYASFSQDYINYRKGALIFYALSDYIGEENLNKALQAFDEEMSFKEAPFGSSLQLLDSIRKVIPDSFQYLIKDFFETITLYDNHIINTETTLLENGKYQVDIEFLVSKYRSNSNGLVRYSDESRDSLQYKKESTGKVISSLPLADYIELGIFGQEINNGQKKTRELYLQKHKIQQIQNRLRIIVDQKPTEVGIDPYNKLIDINAWDNRMEVSVGQ